MQADSPFSSDATQERRGALSDRKSSVSLPIANADYQDDEAPRCPPPSLPVTLIRSWCSTSRANNLHHCQTDVDCMTFSSSMSNRKLKCCHDGCNCVCTAPVDPAPCKDSTLIINVVIYECMLSMFSFAIINELILLESVITGSTFFHRYRVDGR